MDDGFDKLSHRPSSIVHRPSSIVHRPSSMAGAFWARLRNVGD